MFRRYFYVASALVLLTIVVVASFWRPILWSLLLVVPLVAMGLQDALQRKRAVLRNWPLIGRFRYIFEAIRPEIQQYFVERNTDGRPISREKRAVVYQRSKRALDTLPFGTQQDVYAVGYEWMLHSIDAKEAKQEVPRVRIGAPGTTKPYEASLLNVSAMSYGSLSKNSILALNGGAKLGGFAHNTGEGGISPYHLKPGGDLIYQVGTGYFGCRADDGGFDPDQFRERLANPQVVMTELKLSQGAKPGHGGILPAKKVTAEIAKIRGVTVGKEVLSPPYHKAFNTPTGLLALIAQMRELSGGKPVGFKLCVGDPAEFLGICKAMCETGILPDFIAVDGGEGGTGAAPLEFSNAVGFPMREGLMFVHNALMGTGLRDKIKVMVSGKILTGFHIVRALALGADVCTSARGMMFALGCIQARRCHANDCPVGVATQNPALVAGLDVADKTQRVANFHKETLDAFMELLGAAGLEHPDHITAKHVWRRIDPQRSANYGTLFEWLEPGQLLENPKDSRWSAAWERARPDAFVRMQ